MDLLLCKFKMKDSVRVSVISNFKNILQVNIVYHWVGDHDLSGLSVMQVGIRCHDLMLIYFGILFFNGGIFYIF